MQRFADDLLNALSAHIAVLDARGAIVAVNEAWRRFARENGGDPGGYIGASYMNVCEAAQRVQPDAAAAAVREGLHELVAGARNRFSIEYPCHAPEQQRWFIIDATRFVARDGQTYFVTTHHDITVRKRMEQELVHAHRAVDVLNRELQHVLAREQEKARTDHLTGLHNRRHFFELAHQLFSVALRYRTRFAVVMFDVDEFKRINDTFGHHAGDAILRRVARMAREYTRESDVLARYGGEEFIVACPNTTAREAVAAADHIRQQIAECRELVGEHPLSATISIGVAEIMSGEDTLERLIVRADRALYQAKAAGRNCSRVYSSA